MTDFVRQSSRPTNSYPTKDQYCQQPHTPQYRYHYFACTGREFCEMFEVFVYKPFMTITIILSKVSREIVPFDWTSGYFTDLRLLNIYSVPDCFNTIVKEQATLWLILFEISFFSAHIPLFIAMFYL